MFVQCGNWRDYVNTDDIVMLRELKTEGGRRHSFAQMRDGREVNLALSTNLIAAASCPVIAAAKGFEMLSAWINDAIVVVYRQPIIGWRIDEAGVEPIVLDDDSSVENLETGYIKFPDGQVYTSDRLFENELLWKEEMQKMAHERKKTEIEKQVAT